jgi:TRAP-type mannitol/chloroaromatic compound transport system permease large subunit
VPLAEIFRGALPYWLILFAVIVVIAIFPQIATFLPSL